MDQKEVSTGEAGAYAALIPAAGGVSKVAAVTVAFWVLKVIFTTVGDVSGDALSISLGLGYMLALLVALAVFVPLLISQLRARLFVPWLYWALILSSATVGAEISDGMDRALRWGNPAGTAVLLLCLLVTLAVWFRRRGAIGVCPIGDRRDECYYWLAAVFANSSGSALGDLIEDKLRVGVLGGTAVYAGIAALLLILHYTRRSGKGLLFWSAFVVTRIPF
ncbi:MAG: hypothetical protein ACP5PN_04535 [Steroidobacteraceae bacterium]